MESKTYRKKLPILWWTQKWSHLIFIARELTSLAVAYFVIVILFLMRALSKGEEAYHEFMTLLKSPGMIFLSFFVLGGLLFHSISWFNLAPKAMVIKVGKNKVPDVFIALSNYVGWIVISVMLAWFLLNN